MTEESREAAIAMAASELEQAAEHLAATPIDNPFFEEYTFWRVENDDLPPLFAHLAALGAKAFPVEFEDGLSRVVQQEPVAVGTEDEAIAYVEFFLLASRPMAELLTQAAEIPVATEKEIEKWSDTVAPPTAERDGDGWIVQAYIWDGGKLSDTKFRVSPRGSLRAKSEVLDDVGLVIPI